MTNSATTTLSLEELLKRDVIYVIDESNSPYSTITCLKSSDFKMLRETLTYDQFGQIHSAYDCGDYIEVTDDNVGQINNIITSYNEEYNDEYDYYVVGESISAFENSEIFNLLEEAGIETQGTEVLAQNYWNGHNCQTIVIDHPHDDSVVAKLIDNLDTIEYLDTLTDSELNEKRVHYTGDLIK